MLQKLPDPGAYPDKINFRLWDSGASSYGILVSGIFNLVQIRVTFFMSNGGSARPLRRAVKAKEALKIRRPTRRSDATGKVFFAAIMEVFP